MARESEVKRLLGAGYRLLFEGILWMRQNWVIRNELKKHRMGLIYLDVVSMGAIQHTYGREACSNIIQWMRRRLPGVEDIVGMPVIAQRVMGDDLFLYIRVPGGEKRYAEEHLRLAAKKLHDVFEVEVNQELSMPTTIRLYAGCTVIEQTDDVTIQQALYNGIKRASLLAKSTGQSEDHFLDAEFLDILDTNTLRTYFQPICSLSNGDTFGLEALLRGPHGSPFANPEALFQRAERTHQLVRLEKQALQTSLANVRQLTVRCRVFLNINSRSLMDESFSLSYLKQQVELVGLKPSDIVLEITERNLVDDYKALGKLLSPYRESGFAIAVDDAGMGYSSLQAITELLPEYIKIDRSLIRNVDREMVKGLMLETLLEFARKTNCVIVAEGIETEQELQRVIKLGVHYGQGYLLAKPHPSPKAVTDHIRDVIHLEASGQARTSIDAYAIGQLVHPVTTFEDSSRVSDVVQYFKDTDETSVVIVNDNRPLGLVMRDKLFQHLATQYGVPLYWNRGIHTLMDAGALRLENHVSIDVASRLSMERSHDKLYDSLIVTEAGKLQGIVTIQDILSTITAFQMEQARESNPLTHLPGNRQIEWEIERRVQSNGPFSIMYVDIDHFKWLNDRFGVHRGDEVIRLLGSLLCTICTDVVSGNPCFVGHVGGDDFILVTDDPDPARWTDPLIRQFETAVTEDLQRIQTEAELHAPEQQTSSPSADVLNRYGEKVPVSGVTLSISLLHCPNDTAKVPAVQLLEDIGILKLAAKQVIGSACVRGEHRGATQVQLVGPTPLTSV